jgi:hypothetical protein
MTQETYLFAQDTMTHPQMLKTLKRLKRHSKLGFFVDAEQVGNGAMWHVKLFGPKIYWKRKITWEAHNAK